METYGTFFKNSSLSCFESQQQEYKLSVRVDTFDALSGPDISESYSGTFTYLELKDIYYV